MEPLLSLSRVLKAPTEHKNRCDWLSWGAVALPRSQPSLAILPLLTSGTNEAFGPVSSCCSLDDIFMTVPRMTIPSGLNMVMQENSRTFWDGERSNQIWPVQLSLKSLPPPPHPPYIDWSCTSSSVIFVSRKKDQTLNTGVVHLFPLEEITIITYTGSKESELTDHGIQSHKASDKVVKVHVAVFVTVAADDQLVELVVQRETCKRTWALLKSRRPSPFSAFAEAEVHLQPWRQLAPPWSRSLQNDQRRSRCRFSVGQKPVSIATKWIIGLSLVTSRHESSHGFHVASWKKRQSVSPATSWCSATCIWTHGSPVFRCCRSEGTWIKRFNWQSSTRGF